MADMAEDAKEDFVTAEEIEQAEETEATAEAKPASLEKAPLEIAIDDEPKKEDAQVPVEIKSEKPKADAVEKVAQAPDVDAAREKVIAKIAETLDGEVQTAKQQADAKAPVATAVQTNKPQPAPTPEPKKKGFFARLFGR